MYLVRFFTGFGVSEALGDRKLHMTGTVMRNRLPVNLREKILPESAERGSWRLLTNQESTAALTCWKDSRVVLVLISCHTVEPSKTCKRWVKGQKTKKTFPQPDSIAKYNINKGGVDLLDRMLALHPHWAYRTNKWTVRVILHFVMLSAANIWFERQKPMTLFDHVLLLTDQMLAHAKKLEQKMEIINDDPLKMQPTPSAAFRVSDGHLPEHTRGANASRCRYVKSCGGNSRWIYLTYKVPLCLNKKKTVLNCSTVCKC